MNFKLLLKSMLASVVIILGITSSIFLGVFLLDYSGISAGPFIMVCFTLVFGFLTWLVYEQLLGNNGNHGRKSSVPAENIKTKQI